MPKEWNEDLKRALTARQRHAVHITSENQYALSEALRLLCAQRASITKRADGTVLKLPKDLTKTMEQLMIQIVLEMVPIITPELVQFDPESGVGVNPNYLAISEGMTVQGVANFVAKRITKNGGSYGMPLHSYFCTQR